MKKTEIVNREKTMSQIIGVLQQRYGKDFTKADEFKSKERIHQIQEGFFYDKELAGSFAVNELENFRIDFDYLIRDRACDLMDIEEKLLIEIIENKNFLCLVEDYIFSNVCERFKQKQNYLR